MTIEKMLESRFSATYESADGQLRELLMDATRQLMPEGREEEWQLNSEEVDYLDWEWGRTEARGNARFRLAFEVRWALPTVAQLEMAIATHQMAMTARREGWLTLEQAYHLGVAGMRTRWRATLTGIEGGLVPTEADDALPYNPGNEDPLKGSAIGRVRYEFNLSEPKEL